MIHTKDGGSLSTIGSPNFGYRSEIRDNELQFYVMSRNESFNAQLKTVYYTGLFIFYLIILVF